jgi:hypothetical protein
MQPKGLITSFFKKAAPTPEKLVTTPVKLVTTMN